MKYATLALLANSSAFADMALYNVSPKKCTEDAAKTLDCLKQAVKDGESVYADVLDTTSLTDSSNNTECSNPARTVYYGQSGHYDLGDSMMAIPLGIALYSPKDGCVPKVYGSADSLETCPSAEYLKGRLAVEVENGVQLDEHYTLYNFTSITLMNVTQTNSPNIYVEVAADCSSDEKFNAHYALSINYPGQSSAPSGDETTTAAPGGTGAASSTNTASGSTAASSTANASGSTGTASTDTAGDSTSSGATTTMAIAVLSASICLFAL